MTAPAEDPATGDTAKSYLTSLTKAPISEQPEQEEWSATVERLSIPGRIAEITEETWFYFLEVLPPKLHFGNAYAFAEGVEPLRIFWRRNGKHYGRQLTQGETDRVCELTGLPKNYGY